MSVFDKDAARRRAMDQLGLSPGALDRMPDMMANLFRDRIREDVSRQGKDFRSRQKRQQADQLRERISERERGRRQMSPMGRSLTTAGVRTGRQQTGLLSAPDTLPSLLGDA